MRRIELWKTWLAAIDGLYFPAAIRRQTRRACHGVFDDMDEYGTVFSRMFDDLIADESNEINRHEIPRGD